MAKCEIQGCSNIPYDHCRNCGRNICKERHGWVQGDYIYCRDTRDCADHKSRSHSGFFSLFRKPADRQYRGKELAAAAGELSTDHKVSGVSAKAFTGTVRAVHETAQSLGNMPVAQKFYLPDSFVELAEIFESREVISPGDRTSLRASDPMQGVKSLIDEALELIGQKRWGDAARAAQEAIRQAKIAAGGDSKNPYPHAYMGIAWRILAMIAKVAGNMEAAYEGLSNACDSTEEAFSLAMDLLIEELERSGR